MGLDPISDIRDSAKDVLPSWEDTVGYAKHGILYPGRKAKRSAEEEADAQARALQDAQNMRNANIAKLRELFGIGDTAAASSNAQTLNDAIKRLYATMASQGLRQADSGFADASRTSRQNLARVGQLGSGLEANAKSATLSDYLRARQKAITNAAGQRDSLRNQLNSQRMGLEQQIATGQVANPDFQSIIANRDASLSAARSNVVPSAIGQGLTVAGNAYFTGKTQEAQGNQGLNVFNFSNSNNRGSIT
jgi:hypothetical protein